MVLLVLGLLIFFSIHLLPMQTDIRAGLVQRFGSNAYMIGFSLISVIGMVVIILGYGKLQVLAGKNPELWSPPMWTRSLALLMMLPAMILLVAAYVPSRIRMAAKHPMLLAVKLWALAHLLANGDLASVLLFGSFLAFAVIDRISMKRRHAPGPLGNQAGGIIGDAVAVLGGVVLYVVMVVFLHERLIGVALVPGLAG